MEKQYDVVICGAGPAGAAAGISLARRGARVALLDKATFPRKKLCGGLLTWKSVQLLETVFGESVDSLRQAGAIVNAADQYAIRTLKTTLAQGDLSFPFHFVDRATFDMHLRECAKKAGVDTFSSAEVVEADTSIGIVKTKSDKTFKADIIIGADGANSTVRQSFPKYDRERFKQLMAPTIEVALDPKDFPRPVDFPELYIGFMAAGYGWVFPGRDKVVVGICGLRRNKENFSSLFREYMEGLGVDPSVIPPLRGHPLPYGNYLENPAHGRALLAGDAGGFVEPLFGEGLFFALCTGYYAGEAAAEALEKRTRPGPIYTSRLHRQIIPELKASDRLRWALFRAMKYVGPSSIGLFVNTAATPLTEMVHGIRSYSWLRKKHWDFL